MNHFKTLQRILIFYANHSGHPHFKFYGMDGMDISVGVKERPLSFIVTKIVYASSSDWAVISTRRTLSISQSAKNGSAVWSIAWGKNIWREGNCSERPRLGEPWAHVSFGERTHIQELRTRSSDNRPLPSCPASTIQSLGH